jgi:hypothetical protein
VYAEVIDSDTGVTNCYLGLAESVIIKDGIPYVVVGNTAVSVSDVLQVYEDMSADTVAADGTGAI